jgi:hypothetical protein
MRWVASVSLLAAVLATALVSVRLHTENARLRYRLAELERERLRLDRELRLATNALERARAPSALLRLRDERRAAAEILASLPGRGAGPVGEGP